MIPARRILKIVKSHIPPKQNYVNVRFALLMYVIVTCGSYVLRVSMLLCYHYNPAVYDLAMQNWLVIHRYFVT